MHSNLEDIDDADLAEIVATGERLTPGLVGDVIKQLMVYPVFNGVELVDGETRDATK